jgi:hypothetical protein
VTIAVIPTVISKSIGGKLGGIFAAFPAVYLAAVIGLSMDYKGSTLLLVSEQLSKGVLVGMIADICCALAASYMILKYGWKQGLIYAIVLWAIIAPTIYFTWLGF